MYVGKRIISTSKIPRETFKKIKLKCMYLKASKRETVKNYSKNLIKQNIKL